MAYRTQSLREAVFAYQKTMNAKLNRFLPLLGVNFQPFDKQVWNERNENFWHRPNPFRDVIEYTAPIVAVERVLFDTHSVIKSEEPDFAYIDDYINDLPKEVPWTLEYNKGETVDIGKEVKDTVGVGVEQAISIGGKYGGVDFNSTTTVKSNYEKEKLKTLHQQSLNDRKSSTTLGVPTGATYRAEQRQAKAVTEVKDFVHVVFDIAFKAWSNTKASGASLIGERIIDNRRRRGNFPGTKHTHPVLVVKSADDFHEILTGASADYPHQNENLLKKYPKIAKEWEKVINKPDRSFEAVDITEFTKTSHGTIHVLDATNHIVKEIPNE